MKNRYLNRSLIASILFASLGAGSAKATLTAGFTSEASTESGSSTEATAPPLSWAKALEQDPKLAEKANRVQTFFSNPFHIRNKAEQLAADGIFSLLAELRDHHLLKPVLLKIVHAARKHPAFPDISGDDASVVDQLFAMIDAELYSKGKSPLGEKAAFKPWKDLTREQEGLVRASGSSKIGDPKFLDEFRTFLKIGLRKGTQARIVNFAKEALDERVRMISNAKKSIWIATWALYGGTDNAGRIFSDLLIKKFREKIDVRVIVDGQVGARLGYRGKLEEDERRRYPGDLLAFRSESLLRNAPQIYDDRPRTRRGGSHFRRSELRR